MARTIQMDLQIDGTEKAIKDFERLDGTIDETGKSLDSLGDKSISNLSGKFERAAKGFETSARGISGAVNIAAGSFGLLGIEGENIQKTLLKVQSALALTTGFKDMSEFVRDLAGSTQLASVAQAAYTAVVGTSTGAMKLFKLALVSTGIGALVVGLGLLIANFEEVSQYIDEATESFNKLGTGVKVAIAAATLPLLPFIALIASVKKGLEELGILQSQEEKDRQKEGEVKLKRYRDEKAAIDDLNNKKLADIDKEIALNASLGKSVDALNIKRKEEEIAIQKKLEKEAEYYLLVAQRFGFLTEADKKYIDGIKENTAKLELELQVLNNQIITANKQKNDKIASDNKSARDKENDEANKQRQARNDDIKKEEQEDAEIRRKKQEDFVKSEEERISLEKEMKNREDLAAAELKTIEDETDIQAQIDFLAIKRDIELQNTELTESERKLIIEKYQNEIDELREQSEKSWQDRAVDFGKKVEEQFGKYATSVTSLLSTTQQLTDAIFARKLQGVEKGSKEEEKILKKQFKAQKAFQIANALIGGIQGAIQSYNSLAGIPVVGPILGGIAAAAVAATTGLQIATIKKTEFNPGSTDGGGGPPPTPTPTPPDFSQIGNGAGSTIGQIRGGSDTNTGTGRFGFGSGAVGGASNIEGIGGGSSSGSNGPQRVYVVESDITGVQNRVNVIQTDSTIG